MNKSVPVCENHLSELYEALREENLPEVYKIEHELTESEKCVACAYVFKTAGTVREALMKYLNGEGYEVEGQAEAVTTSNVANWIMRIVAFFAVFAVYIFMSALLKNYLLKLKTFSLFPFSIMEMTAIGVVALLTFLIIDDRLLE